MKGPGPASARTTWQPWPRADRSTKQPFLPASWVSVPRGTCAPCCFGAGAAKAPRGSSSRAKAVIAVGNQRVSRRFQAEGCTRGEPIPPRGHASVLVHLQVAEHADANPQPGIGGGVEGVVLRLQADRREPELVDGGVGDAAVQPSPDPAVGAAATGGRRGDRVGPLDRVAALVEGSPGRGCLGLADRARGCPGRPFRRSMP